MGIKRPTKRLLVGGLFGLGLLWIGWPATPVEVSTFAPLPPTTPDGLEKVYAPLLVMDSQETFPPIAVEAWLAQAEFRSDGSHLRQPALVSPAPPGAIACWRGRCGTYLTALTPVKTTAFATYTWRRTFGPETELAYWWFYAYNDATPLQGPPGTTLCGNHEGEWEHIALRINTQAAQQATTATAYQAAIRAVYFARHGRSHFNSKTYPPQALRFQGSHVKVYPALGTHGAYPEPGIFPLPLKLGPWHPQDRSDGKGTLYTTWAQPLLPLDQQPWATFSGRWGAIRQDACNLLEKLTESANDGPFAPGHGTKAPFWLKGDW